MLIADRIACQYPEVFESEFVGQLFQPLLLFEDTRRDASLVANEDEVLESVTLATLLLCGPPPSQHLLEMLAPVILPMLHMYSFAVSSKSVLAQILQVTIVGTFLAHSFSRNHWLALYHLCLIRTIYLFSMDQNVSGGCRDPTARCAARDATATTIGTRAGLRERSQSKVEAAARVLRWWKWRRRTANDRVG